jgi:DNA-binding CsgD family transcriptional regulator/pimeloyl-ACP methyl ester carboxylesterase
MDPPPVQYVQTSDGYSIAYGISGEGPLLIHVPTLFSHFSTMWSRLYFGALAARFRLVLYDSRGQGLSSRGLPESLALSDYTRDLEAIIARLGARQFVLCGMGVGPEVAIKYAVDHPDQVQALLLCNYRDMHGSTTSEAMLTMAQDWEMYVGTVARVGYPMFDPGRATAMLFDSTSQEDHILRAVAIRKVSGEQLLRQVKVPTLFLTSRSNAWAHQMQTFAQRLASRSQNFHLFTGEEFPITDASIQAAVEFVRAVEVDQGAGVRPEHSNDAQLSPREVDVLRLIAAGKSNQQIASELVISLSTVLHHVTNILTKTGCHNRTEAAAYAHRHRLT